MGMYDSFEGDYQIKIFNVPVAYYGCEETLGSILGFAGGSLHDYSKSDVLPLHTLWYKYPKNFIILDYSQYANDLEQELNDLIIHIIKKGHYCTSTNFKTFSWLKTVNVYDYYGNQLNITSKSDIYNHLKLIVSQNKESNDLSNLYFPNGYMELLKNNMLYYQMIKDKYFQQRSLISDKYSSQLYIENKHLEEHKLGGYIDLCLTERLCESDDNFKLLKAEFKQYIESLSEDYFKKFLEYNKELLSDDDATSLQCFINTEILNDEE